MEEFIQDRIVNQTVAFHNRIKRNKLKTFANAEVRKTLKSTQNKMTQIKAERNIFGQLVLLSVQNDIDFQVTLTYPFDPVPWSLASADGMPVKTGKAKLLHYLESSVEALLLLSKEDVVHIIDGNAVLQSLISIPDNFEDLADAVFSLLPKLGRVDFVTDPYKPMSIKSFERRRRGSTELYSLAIWT